MSPVFVITGPSGAGKGTLIKALVERLPELEVAVSATTRQQRPGESDGVEYWFLTESDFVARVGAGEFLEHVRYVSGKRYGTLRSEITRIAGEGRVCVLELELDGALRVQEEVPRSVTIFIAAPVEELERRLRGRASDSEEVVRRRFEAAKVEIEHYGFFDYLVVNDDVESAFKNLEGIVLAERSRRLRRADLAERLLRAGKL